MEVKRVEGSTITVDQAPIMKAGEVLRVGLAPTWSTVVVVGIGCLITGICLGVLNAAVFFR